MQKQFSVIQVYMNASYTGGIVTREFWTQDWCIVAGIKRHKTIYSCYHKRNIVVYCPK
uniref:Uncharacterized protein n=1 Tax=Arundo donax TaxID=35708 RepID=A0A0A9HG29_ARUDO